MRAAKCALASALWVAALLAKTKAVHSYDASDSGALDYSGSWDDGSDGDVGMVRLPPEVRAHDEDEDDSDEWTDVRSHGNKIPPTKNPDEYPHEYPDGPPPHGPHGPQQNDGTRGKKSHLRKQGH